MVNLMSRAWMMFAALVSCLEAAPKIDSQDSTLTPAKGLPWVDGHAFMAYGRNLPFPTSDYRGATWGGWVAWTPEVLNVQGRISLGLALFQPSVGSPTGNSGRTPVMNEVDLDEVWLRFPFHLFSWSMAAQGGNFRWRPNPDALLMGGYLARWGAYPHTVFRPGRPWETLDSLSTLVTGFRFGMASPEGAFRQEALALLDTLGGRLDASVVYGFDATPMEWFDVGASVQFFHLDWLGGMDTHRMPTRDTGNFIGGPIETDSGEVVYLTHSSTSVAARMGVDLTRLIKGEPAVDGAGRIFAEAALLGLKNYGKVYPDRGLRLRIMAGMNLPGMGFLDAIRVQIERAPYAKYQLPDIGRDSLGNGNGSWISGLLVGLEQPRHFWTVQGYAAKDLLSWLALQGWYLYGRPEEDAPASPYGPNYLSSNRILFGEARLVARF